MNWTPEDRRLAGELVRQQSTADRRLLRAVTILVGTLAEHLGLDTTELMEACGECVRINAEQAAFLAKHEPVNTSVDAKNGAGGGSDG